jgi:hypothetical protein
VGENETNEGQMRRFFEAAALYAKPRIVVALRAGLHLALRLGELECRALAFAYQKIVLGGLPRRQTGG